MAFVVGGDVVVRSRSSIESPTLHVYYVPVERAGLMCPGSLTSKESSDATYRYLLKETSFLRLK
jgi:hypothetical protein